MKKNKKGFTLVELLAVIVVLAIIITVASSSVFAIINHIKKETSEEMRKSLGDIAITYVLDNFHLQKCSETFSKEVFEQGNIAHLSSNGTCAKKITVDTLVKEGLFEDQKNFCKMTEFVVVYRYSNEVTGEYKVYVPENTCTNY